MKSKSSGLRYAAEVIGNRLADSAERKLLSKERLGFDDSFEREDLEKQSIADLYRIIESRAQIRNGDLAVIRQTVRGQIAFLSDLIPALKETTATAMPMRQANTIAMRYERSFLDRLAKMGMRVRFDSEVDQEKLEQKPNLILATHQGGGWENYLFQGLTGLPCSPVVKDDLMKLPYIKDSLNNRGVITVDRKKLKPDDARDWEIARIVLEIALRLEEGGNVIVFFEGTRSTDGEIAGTPARRKWAKDLLEALDKLWIEEFATDGLSFQKQLMVFHTMVALPDTPEKDVFLSRFRPRETVAAKLVNADNLVLSENPENPYDGATLFGKARTVLKRMLIEDILENK